MLRIFFFSGLVNLFRVFWREVILCIGLLTIIYILIGSEFHLSFIRLEIETDYVRRSLILLRIWLIGLCLLGRIKIKNNKIGNYFVICHRLLLFFLIIRFSVRRRIFFYVGFERCLIPVFLLVIGWGYQPERIQAGSYLFFYTLFGSFPLFFIIVWGYINEGRFYFYIKSLIRFDYRLFFIFLVSAFLVKFPLYGVHLWLLKAHVEAPVAGSIILAGILLKLGGYGLIRLLGIFEGKLNFMVEVFVVIRLWGGFLVRVRCLRQVDIKLLIAISSVVHIRICICSIIIINDLGIKGSLIMIISHGLCSSGLFYMANLVYERSNSRSLLVSKGLLNFMPSISLWWFLLIRANIAAPPSLNLAREVFIVICLIRWDISTIVRVGLISFFRVSYGIYLFSMSQHGSFLRYNKIINSGYITEYLVCFLHLLPVNLFILRVWIFLYFHSLIKILYCGYKDALSWEYWNWS